MSYNLSYIESSRPTRQYKYKELIQRALEEIKNRRFRYDASDDPEYRRHSQRAIRRAKRAMEDTMAKGMELSGSRINSFANSLAQQKYNEGLSEIDTIIPALEKIALDRYNAEGKSLSENLDGLKALDTLEQRDYERLLSAWQKDRDYYYKKYRDELARMDKSNKKKSSSGGKKKTKTLLAKVKSYPNKSLKRIIEGRRLA